MGSPYAPRYDRIVSLIAVVLMGLAVVFLIDPNPNTLRIELWGDLPSISASWILIGSLVVITSVGADLLARSHPEMEHRVLPTISLGMMSLEIAPAFWVLPSFAVISSFAFFRLFNGWLGGGAFALAILAAGGGLLAVVVCQHYGLDRRPEVSQRAQLALQVIAFVLAFGAFSAAYSSRMRTLYTAMLIGGAAMLLAYPLLHWATRRPVVLRAALVGLTLAEVTWALNYWALPYLLGGTVLLAIFYVIASLLQHQATGSLQRRLLIEYGLIGCAMLLTVVWITFRA